MDGDLLFYVFLIIICICLALFASAYDNDTAKVMEKRLGEGAICSVEHNLLDENVIWCMKPGEDDFRVCEFPKFNGRRHVVCY